MGHTGHYLHLVFLMTTVLPSSPGTTGNYTHLWANSITASGSINQNSTSRHPSEKNTNLVPPASPPSVPSAPASTPKPSLPRGFRNSSPTAEVKSQGETFTKEACEDNTSNTAVLICLIVIAVLFLICTFLFLSTVVLANKVSSLRRSKQVGKRQPRSNGDFLASSGLWTAESDTWKRAKELTGPNLPLQSTGVLTAARERKHEGGTEKLN